MADGSAFIVPLSPSPTKASALEPTPLPLIHPFSPSSPSSRNRRLVSYSSLYAAAEVFCSIFDVFEKQQIISLFSTNPPPPLESARRPHPTHLLQFVAVALSLNLPIEKFGALIYLLGW